MTTPPPTTADLLAALRDDRDRDATARIARHIHQEDQP